MQGHSNRVRWRECARRRRCHGRLGRQQDNRAGVSRLGCDVVDAVIGDASDDEVKRGKAKKSKMMTKSVAL